MEKGAKKHYGELGIKKEKRQKESNRLQKELEEIKNGKRSPQQKKDTPSEQRFKEASKNCKTLTSFFGEPKIKKTKLEEPDVE